MVRRGRVNTLIVAKRDRLSRSLRDVRTLVEELFWPPADGLWYPAQVHALLAQEVSKAGV